MRAVFGPRDEAHLAGHLSDSYGIEVADTRALDHGVWRIVRADGADWVARLFLPGRGEARVRHDAALLARLEAEDVAAERPAADDAVTMLGEHPVLVTRFIDGRTPGKSKRDLVSVADTLGRLLKVICRRRRPVDRCIMWRVMRGCRSKICDWAPTCWTTLTPMHSVTAERHSTHCGAQSRARTICQVYPRV